MDTLLGSLLNLCLSEINMFSLYFPLLFYSWKDQFFFSKIVSFWHYVLVKVNGELKNTIKWVYATEELQDFYKSKHMLDFKKKASMYSGGGDLSLIFGKFPVTEEEQTAIDIFLMKKVTKKITMDTVALTLWLLQRHYGNGKLSWDQGLTTFHASITLMHW